MELKKRTRIFKNQYGLYAVLSAATTEDGGMLATTNEAADQPALVYYPTEKETWQAYERVTGKIKQLPATLVWEGEPLFG